MTRGRFWLVAVALTATIALLCALGLKRIKEFSERRAISAAAKERRAQVKHRYRLFDMLQPVALANCQLERFGEPNDGGYLMCGNLLGAVQSGYSYGISGYDKWGCDISTKLNVTVHQYDCFNTTRPACPAGKMVFHEECVGDTKKTDPDGRLFDTIKNQFAKNGDSSKRIVLKIDVEGAEWDSFLGAPDEIFEQIDQMAVEFHGVRSEKCVRAVRRLKQFFEVAHIHYNNASCQDGIEPFPTWAYEVLFVNKRLAVVDPSRKAGGLHPLDARNFPSSPDCLPKSQ